MAIESSLPASSGRRFRLGVQKTRAATYLLASCIGLVFRQLGALDISFREVLVLGTVAIVSALLFSLMARADLGRRMALAHSTLWMICDALLISWAVWISGAGASPWFPWYLANISGAAFVMGQAAGFAIAGLDTVLYVAVLWLHGDVTAPGVDLYVAIARIAFLYGASFLFLRGVSILKRKQRVINTIRLDEQKKLEELTRLTAALDQRTRELEDANLRIREADRLKSQFLANMSHELRTPLNSIIGFSDVLLSRLPEDLPPRYEKFLTNIHSSGQHLLGIINDLLDLSKIEAGKMELCPEPVEIPLVVQGVCSIMQGTARSRNIRFEVVLDPGLPTVETDPVKIKQILFNLVSNALKFSDEASVVRISVSHRVEGGSDGGSVLIAVEDHGVGIAAKDHRVIFEEFRQVDGSSTRAFGGTGLGLALVKRLVELHGGTITVESAPGEGSTFTISLPVRFRGKAGLISHSVPETLDLPSERGPRVLVVEDDPTAFELISGHLRESGFVPLRARNATEAMTIARNNRPDAITLDIILPGTDGWEVLKRLKSDEGTRAIPVIIVSVLDNPELAVTLGAADYLTKPVQREALVQRLEGLITDGSPHRHRLLLIDDDPELHELVEARLTALGYTIEHALNGRDGLVSASRKQPELIILDLMMEEMDGFEVATKLKEDNETAHIPVIVLTAKEMDQQDHDRLRHKIEALVGKSEIPGDRLVGVIERVLMEDQHEQA